MRQRLLKLKDGFADHSPGSRPIVKILQFALQNAGYDIEVDGLFGRKTEKAIKTFQTARGLTIDGIVGANTWREIAQAKNSRTLTNESLFEASFRGDLHWIHDREGHVGKPYWPGGDSGVTFDPGVDLGYAKPENIDKAYKKMLTTEQLNAARKVYGIKGKPAGEALKNSPVLQSIRFDYDQATIIFPFAARPYWRAIVERFPVLSEPDTLASVQTVLLSLAYNRGPKNSSIDILKLPLAESNWAEVADLVGSMQQNHKLPGVRKRRLMEAQLIRKELKELGFEDSTQSPRPGSFQKKRIRPARVPSQK
ncbi:MAG: hypothetical protein GY839_05805 [candidate division Zixibacteria bacterium]|nr:hypothetical protein [candidate division Zixibacteria bacterium]